MGKIFLNFFLITVVGGVFTFWLSARRDAWSRRESALSALRDLIKEVDGLYRSTKQIKRMIRSRLRRISEGRAVPEGALIDATFFATRMDELSNIQLELEQVRNAVRIRLDLFDGERKDRILKEIEYSEKYIHGVVADFALRRVIWDDKNCRLSASCKMLMDFLGEGWRPSELTNEFTLMDDAATSLERFNAFQRINNNAKLIDSEYERHKSISDECMLLAIREMRDIIVERQP